MILHTGAIHRGLRRPSEDTTEPHHSHTLAVPGRAASQIAPPHPDSAVEQEHRYIVTLVQVAVDIDARCAPDLSYPNGLRNAGGGAHIVPYGDDKSVWINSLPNSIRHFIVDTVLGREDGMTTDHSASAQPAPRTTATGSKHRDYVQDPRRCGSTDDRLLVGTNGPPVDGGAALRSDGQSEKDSKQTTCRAQH